MKSFNKSGVSMKCWVSGEIAGDMKKMVPFGVSECVFEAQFDEGECPFQYILTTTTAPPKELKSDKYTPLRLNAAKSDELLFRSNFKDSQKQMKLFGGGRRRLMEKAFNEI